MSKENINIEQLSVGDLFKHFIKNAPELQDSSKGSSYRLIEDIKLILACCSMEKIRNKDYKNFETQKIVNRSADSIRERFTHFLQTLTEKDLNQIAHYLKTRGINGYLVFSSGNNKKLLQISERDPKSLFIQEERKKLSQDDDIVKKIKLNNDQPFNKTNFQQTKHDLFSINEIDDVLTLVAEIKHVPKSIFVEKLHQVSGDLNDLDDYLYKNNTNNCWSAIEDQVLCETQKIDSLAMQVIVQNKGKDKVKRRIEYLNIQNRFQ